MLSWANPVILRLYLHRETCTPEPGYETGQGGPACSGQSCIQLLFAEAACVPLRCRVHVVCSSGGCRRRVHGWWCIDGWICIERGGKCNARYSQAKAKPLATHVLPSLFTRSTGRRSMRWLEEVGVSCYVHPTNNYSAATVSDCLVSSSSSLLLLVVLLSSYYYSTPKLTPLLARHQQSVFGWHQLPDPSPSAATRRVHCSSLRRQCCATTAVGHYFHPSNVCPPRCEPASLGESERL